MKTVIHNARLLSGEAVTVFIDDHVIRAIGKGDLAAAYTADEMIDAGGAYLVPGLIDIHSHGCIGMDAMDGRGLGDMADEYLRRGVTTWYPTTMTESGERIRAALEKQVRGREAGGEDPANERELLAICEKLLKEYR